MEQIELNTSSSLPVKNSSAHLPTFKKIIYRHMQSYPVQYSDSSSTCVYDDSTQRKPTQARGEYANSRKKCPATARN